MGRRGRHIRGKRLVPKMGKVRSGHSDVIGPHYRYSSDLRQQGGFVQKEPLHTRFE